MKTILKILCFLCLGLLWSCKPIESYSSIPEIHFISLSFEDVIVHTSWGTETETMAILNFSFIDGDGDIGAKTVAQHLANDCISKIHYTWFEKISDDEYKPYVFPATGATTISVMIPWGTAMDKDGAQNKTLRGTITIALTMPRNPPDVEMQVRYFIVDRAGNESNVNRTPDFSILNLPDIIYP